MSEFGMFVKDQKIKITNGTSGKYGKILKLPGSIGWKQKDGTWENEFYDLIFFEKDWPRAELIETGDRIIVSGKVQLSSWTNREGVKKAQWSILVSEFDTGKPEGQPVPPVDGDIPF